MYNLAQIDEMLTESGAILSRLRQYSPLRAQVSRLSVQQQRLEEIRKRMVQQARGQNLGLIIALGIGMAIAGLSALGIRAWQHHEETKKTEAETDLVNELLKKGYSLEDIAIIYGDRQSSLDKVMSRMIVLAGLIGGILVFWKLK